MSNRRRSPGSYARYQAARLGDLRHMVRCMKAGRLPDHIDYIEGLLSDPTNLPEPLEIATWCQFTQEQREANQIWTIPPIDKTVDELRQIRKARDRQRKMLANLNKGGMTRD